MALSEHGTIAIYPTNEQFDRDNVMMNQSLGYPVFKQTHIDMFSAGDEKKLGLPWATNV